MELCTTRNMLPNDRQVLLRQWVRPALLFGILSLSFLARLAIAQEVEGGCGSLKRGEYDPVDYREAAYGANKVLLELTNRDHFTQETQSLRRGKSSTTAGPDIDYTLRVYPNHHRALIAMVALGEKERTSKPVGSHYSIECWFRRAVKFRPDDNIVRMLYAQYLFKAKRENEADQELGVAASQAGDNAFTQNNIGLIYFDMKNYEKALVHAHKAYGLGFGSPTLRNQLRSVGKWSEADVAQPVELPKNPQ